MSISRILLTCSPSSLLQQAPTSPATRSATPKTIRTQATRSMSAATAGRAHHARPGCLRRLQEIVRILEADPSTDWSKIDLAASRQHLIDMHEVTLWAAAAERAVDNGLQVDVTGTGQTLDAIRCMLPVHGRGMNGLSDWRAVTETIADGVRLTVTSSNPSEVAHIRGLGFIGLGADLLFLRWINAFDDERRALLSREANDTK